MGFIKKSQQVYKVNDGITRWHHFFENIELLMPQIGNYNNSDDDRHGTSPEILFICTMCK